MEEFDMKWNGANIPNKETFITPLSLVAASQYLDKIEFTKMVNQHVSWDIAQCNLSPGMLAKSVVLSTFTTKRSPLCHINQVFSGMDLEGLFGLACWERDFTDDAIARTLDKIYEANANALYSNISLSCLAKFDLSLQSLHCDTSSISLSGAYDLCEEETYKGLSVCHGYSKDKRPDLKQVMVGKIVTEQGFPIVSMPLDGNTADSEFNQEALKLLSNTFGKHMEEVIYIADSKLINKPTLKVLHEQPVRITFISRCPDGFHDKIAVKTKKRAFSDNQWVDQGILGDNKRCAHYHTQSYQQSIDGQNYRLIVVQTSAGRNRTDKTLTKNEIEVKQLIESQQKRQFACEADAKIAKSELDTKLKSSYHLVEWNIVSQETQKRPRGNPGKNPKPDILKITWSLQGAIVGLASEKVEQLRQKDESFVLITNLSEAVKSDRDVLLEYKRQFVVEVQFHLLKQQSLAAPIFLKKPERIQALLMLLAVALLIRSLIQLQVRHRLKSYAEKPKIGPNKTRLTNPTAEAVLLMLRLHSIHRKGDEAWCPCYDETLLYQFNTWVDLLNLTFDD